MERLGGRLRILQVGYQSLEQLMLYGFESADVRETSDTGSRH